MSKRVVVAMSGGVDSSVAAFLLKKQGFEVIGIMLRLWAEDGESQNRCCNTSSLVDARSIAAKLDIPFYVLDYRHIFKNHIVDGFLTAYQNGITPNPCFDCNRYIRFGNLLKEALKLKADFLSTGHYAKLMHQPTGYYLKTACDLNKDQTYMLYKLGQFELSHALFPLGDYLKSEVRKIAAQNDLISATKKDSQDLCFLGKQGQKGFVKRHIPHSMQPGDIKNLQNQTVGQHSGLAQYTIGQRKGLNISATQPYYVVKIDKQNNQLVVAHDLERGNDAFTVRNFHFVIETPLKLPFFCKVKLRYKSPFYDAVLTDIKKDQLLIKLNDKVKDITPGQGAVIYHQTALIGGGTIDKTIL